jgi:hypothetical protein
MQPYLGIKTEWPQENWLKSKRGFPKKLEKPCYVERNAYFGGGIGSEMEHSAVRSFEF